MKNGEAIALFLARRRIALLSYKQTRQAATPRVFLGATHARAISAKPRQILEFPENTGKTYSFLQDFFQAPAKVGKLIKKPAQAPEHAGFGTKPCFR